MFPIAATLERLTADLTRDLSLFIPELILCGTIPFLLLLRLLFSTKTIPLAPVALAAVGTALVFALRTDLPTHGGTVTFGGMLLIDRFGLSVRVALLAYLLLAIPLGVLTKIPDREDAADFFTLMIGATIGLMLMTSARHLLMVFIAVEMASVPSYALAGFLKGRRPSSEAALKYVVFGAAASGTMLYGISLVAGTFGTGDMEEIAGQISYSRTQISLSAFAGVLLIFGGILFKLSAVPFHFWCPDVFTGAAAEVGAFLSVASKAASLALAARLIYYLGGTGVSHTNALAVLWAIIAGVTMTWGNLAAFGQTNVKRMLAYSTIAHAGLMMMTLTVFDYRAVPPLVYYIASYLCMNLGAFAVVAFVRNQTGSEELDTFDGLAKRSPVLALSMTVFMLSLLGLPPLAGFAAKFQVFAHLFENAHRYQHGEIGVFSWLYTGLLALAAINTALSAGYYLGVVRRMFLDTGEEAKAPLSVPFGGRVILSVLVGGVIALGGWWNPLTEQGIMAAKSFQHKSAKQKRLEMSQEQ
ncbi:NADH-quinone oxidoreductase subunit N [Zavarzinella formosa]|uniref:NADH-quinone oxidoreductase subunit N n=1 Tax=Zavarzinella formosa TaxID=360055 RepID=UPI0002DB8159|nr:NADH-quinone oxidoreductase subunit N [Zavarzinella formosa]